MVGVGGLAVEVGGGGGLVTALTEGVVEDVPLESANMNAFASVCTEASLMLEGAAAGTLSSGCCTRQSLFL